MEWTESLSRAVEYIENNIEDDITFEEIARYAYLSPFYFQKGFAMLCGFTVGEYIKKRRLALAGSELISTDHKIIDIAVKYGYDSPDSFTKAFTRFHGATPSAIRKGDAMIKSFAPLKIKFVLEGGYTMDYKIVDKDAFTIIGVSKVFKYEEALSDIPKMWADHYRAGNGKTVCGMFGINIDESMMGNEFEYLIADVYNPSFDVPEGFVTKTIPKLTWAVFACHGPMPTTIQDINKKIFSEWLPNAKDYEIAAGYNIEMYNDPAEYKKGTSDENYYCEIWIPVKKK